ncbi:DNA-binding protein [Actinocorallia aurea]
MSGVDIEGTVVEGMAIEGMGTDAMDTNAKDTEGGDASMTAELLAAGAVLPPGAQAEGAVPIAARSYTHPALDDRVVVRLAPADLGAAEDLAAGFLGLVPDGEPAIVGAGPRQTLGFPEWVLAHHPEDGHRALAVVPELERLAKQAKTKPKAAMDGLVALGQRLASSVPHLLPTYFERAGRAFLAVENAQYAGQLFSRARKAEVEHGLDIDEDRLDEVFLEYALAGALPVKTLSGYAKELSARVSPGEALRRYTTLCLRRASGGMPPSAQMGNDLRKLAREAGDDALSVEIAFVGEMLELPATARAGAGWWKAHRAALVELARRRPETRGLLLDLLPSYDDHGLSALWLDVLTESGAIAGLYDDSVPAAQRPKDGSAGWLRRYLKFRRQGWREASRVPALEELVVRMADRLRADLADGGELPIPYSVDLLDLMLELGLPVAAPDGRILQLESWARAEERRDLVSLGADDRFHESLHLSFDRLGSGEVATFRALAAAPGVRNLLTEWVHKVAERSWATGLPGLPAALHMLSWLPGDILSLAEDAVRAATRADLGEILARTLRTGLFDEFSWPAFEEAVGELSPRENARDLIIAEEWPYLVVANKAKAVVVGLEGRVLEHELRTPSGAREPGFHFVDGDLLVHWESGDTRHGYWTSEPGRVLRMQGEGTADLTLNWHRGNEPVTLPVPGGGRTTALGVIHSGDSVVPETGGLVITDGRSHWVQRYRDGGVAYWTEYDPASGELGRESAPEFLTRHAGDPADGEVTGDGWILPFPGAGPTPVGPVVDGLVGLRYVRRPGSGLRAEDMSGTSSLYSASYLPGTLYFPGDDRPRTYVRQSWRVDLHDVDGTHTAQVVTDGPAGDYALGTVILPPLRYWSHLTARDERGSALLRRVDAATCAALLEAVVQGDDPVESVRALLPEVTHEGLIAGIVGVTQKASAERIRLDETVQKLEQTLKGEVVEEQVEGPSDRMIHEALGGITGATGYRGDESRGIATILHRFAVLAGGAEEPAAPGAVHLDERPLAPSRLSVESVLRPREAGIYRALSWTGGDEARPTLRYLSEAFDRAGLTADAAGRWREVGFGLPRSATRLANGNARPGHRRGTLGLEGGAFLAFGDWDNREDTDLFRGLFHDPSGAFEPPAPYEAESCAEIEGWWSRPLPPAAYLAELDERGPAPWSAESAAEFARLTGTTPTIAALVVAGLPGLDDHQHSFLPAEVRKALGVRVAEAGVARSALRALPWRFRCDLVGALLPADPAELWTRGPDVAAAAEVWNKEMGGEIALPEALLAEAKKAVFERWDLASSMRAVLAPASSPELTRDLAWKVSGDKVVQADEGRGFGARTLTSVVLMAAWLAHRLPAGDPLRAGLPDALEAVRARLAHPGLMLGFDRYFDVTAFRKAAGAPTEEGLGFVRYGAIVLSTHDTMPYPALKTSLLDEAGEDPYLPALRSAAGEPFPIELALRIVKSERFAALLADPGDPAGGERFADGTWYPHDPSRSVPDVVAEVSAAHSLSADAAAVYLMLLALPDPTDRNTARWTGWKPARLKAARAELAATDLVVEARRTRAGRTLFLPGAWTDARAPRPSMETWKHALFDLTPDGAAPLRTVVPTEPVADLFRKAWRRIAEGDGPRFADLKVRKGGRRR